MICPICRTDHDTTACQNRVLNTPPSRPHVCPVCNGAGIVSRPPWVAGDVATWVASSVETYPCKACAGSGVIWSAA